LIRLDDLADVPVPFGELFAHSVNATLTPESGPKVSRNAGSTALSAGADRHLGDRNSSQPGWPFTPPLIWRFPDTYVMRLSPFGLTSSAVVPDLVVLIFRLG